MYGTTVTLMLARRTCNVQPGMRPVLSFYLSSVSCVAQTPCPLTCGCSTAAPSRALRRMHCSMLCAVGVSWAGEWWWRAVFPRDRGTTLNWWVCPWWACSRLTEWWRWLRRHCRVGGTQGGGGGGQLRDLWCMESG